MRILLKRTIFDDWNEHDKKTFLQQKVKIINLKVLEDLHLMRYLQIFYCFI